MINKKRNSLEQFIREQTYGPGINGYRFVDIENTNLLNKDITTLPPITYEDEIIDIVPAAVYSTGILFPEEEKTIDGSISGFDSLGMTNNEILETEDDEEKDFQNSSNSDIDDRDGIQLDQMFPKLMGLTCCLNEEFLLEKKISIKLFARYYTKLHRDKNGLFNKRYGLLIETDSNNLEEFIKKHSLDDFYIKESGPNRILFIRYQDTSVPLRSGRFYIIS